MCIRFTEPWEPAEVGGTQASAPFIFVKDQNVKNKKNRIQNANNEN
jgi:hypothetical protein